MMRQCLIGMCLLIAYFGMALWRGGDDFAFFIPDLRQMFGLSVWAFGVFAFLWLFTGRQKVDEL